MGYFSVTEELTAAIMNAVTLDPVAKSENYRAAAGEFVLVSGGHTVYAPDPTAGTIWGAKATDANTSNGFGQSLAATDTFYAPGLGSDGDTAPAIGSLGAFCIWIGDGTDWHLIAGNVESGAISVASADYTNNWAASGAGVTYRKIGDWLIIEGGIKGGTAGESAFTLASGYRPTTGKTCAVINYNSGLLAANMIVVNSNGTVIPSLTDSAAVYIEIVVPLS